MVTPHLPPEQAANALLPQLLADGLRARGDDVRLMALYPSGSLERRADVTYVPRMGVGLSRRLRLSHLALTATLVSTSRPFLSGVDVVHVHSNTFMNQVMTAIIRSRRLPFVLTHYGTEIWHYRPRMLDFFRWMNARAGAVTYYSRQLMERSLELGICPKKRSVVYPPVATVFGCIDEGERDQKRKRLRVGDGPVILNVKRLHPLAGQRFAIEAMPSLLERHPGTQLWIAGEGEERENLERQIGQLGLNRSVRLLGMLDHQTLVEHYQAADLFVLPSRLEAFPTVAVEALACGLRVVSASHPGGQELAELFGDDVALVPIGDSRRLAEAIERMLAEQRKASLQTRERIEAEFRPSVAIETYRRLYEEALAG